MVEIAALNAISVRIEERLHIPPQEIEEDTIQLGLNRHWIEFEIEDWIEIE